MDTTQEGGNIVVPDFDIDIAPYTPADRLACMGIFDSNVPDFFASSERTSFAEFLDKPLGHSGLGAIGRRERSLAAAASVSLTRAEPHGFAGVWSTLVAIDAGSDGG